MLGMSAARLCMRANGRTVPTHALLPGAKRAEVPANFLPIFGSAPEARRYGLDQRPQGGIVRVAGPPFSSPGNGPPARLSVHIFQPPLLRRFRIILRYGTDLHTQQALRGRGRCILPVCRH